MDNATRKAIIALAGGSDVVDAVMPLTTTQRDLYLDALKNPHGKGHQVVLYGIIDSDVNLGLWKQNLAGFVMENPILRTKFLYFEDQIYQVAVKETAPLFSFIDRSDIAPDRESIQALIQQMEFPDQDLSHPLVHHYLIKAGCQCYIVLFRIHHVLIDGSCGKIYVEKICNRYFSLLHGTLTDTAPDYSFFDYVPVHLGLFDRPAVIEYWRNALADVNVANGQYGNTQSDHVVSVLLAIPEEHHRQVTKYCRNNNIKESYYWMVVLALVYRYQFDINGNFSLRTFAGGRRVHHGDTVLEYDQALGCFYHIIPVIFGEKMLSSGLEFHEIVKLVAGQVSGLGENRFISMMFQNNFLNGETLTLYYNYQPFWEIAVDGRKSYFEERYHEMGNQVELRIAFTHDRLELHLDYNARYFNGCNFLDRILLLSEQLAGQGAAVTELDYLLPAEAGLFNRVNSGQPLPLEQPAFPEAWRQAAHLFPGHTAVSCGSRKMTYLELDRQSDSAAAILQNRYGVRKGDLIGVLLPRSPETVSLILGIWKAGGAYLPLSDSLPPERIASIVHTAGLRIIFAGDAWLRLKEELPACEIVPGTLQGSDEPGGNNGPELPVLHGDLAYVIFTSGSTGVPKGACIEHSGMINHMLAKKEQLSLTAADKIAQTASVSFDISVWQLFNGLLVGAETVVYTDELMLDVAELLQRASEDGITILEVVPSYLELMLDVLQQQPEGMLTALRYLMITGEELKPGLVKRWFTLFPHIPLVNAYGPTEAADDITHHVLYTAVDSERIPVGRPIPNMSIHIINGTGQRCGFYMRGEICVSGAGVGRGYLNDRTGTEKVFLSDPWSPGLRMYRTGDMGRWLPDGTIDFLGRQDGQVKLKGYRIELGEIEHAVESHPAVTQAAALVVQEEGVAPYLCCYYTAREELTDTDIYAAMRKRLPAYMLPSYLIQLPAFPLTAHGKVNRKALPLPHLSKDGPAPDADTQIPVDDPVCGIWCEVLQVNACTLADNFFEKGGDSIKALRLMNRLKKDLKIDLPVTTIFVQPVLQAFLHAVGCAAAGENVIGWNDIPVAPVQDRYPLSFGQERLLLTEKLSDAAAAYVMAAAFRFRGAFNRAAFEWAVQQLVNRHEILRVSFSESGGRLQQSFATGLAIRPAYIDLRNNQDPENAMQDIAAREADTPFDLGAAPLFRTTLLQLREDEYVFIYAVHHLLTDGWSKSVISNDLGRLYNLALAAASEGLPSLSLQYKDFCCWQRDIVRSAGMLSQKRYWQSMLSGSLPVTTFSLDFTRPARRTFDGETLTFFLTTADTERLKDCCITNGITMFHLLIAAVNMTLYQYTPAEKLLVGTSVSGRNHSSLEDQIGFYVNTLPLLSTVDPGKPLSDNVRQISNNALSAFANQDYPFLLMLEDLDTTGGNSIRDLINVYVEFHNYRPGVPETGIPLPFHGLECELIREHHTRALFDMEFNFEIINEQLSLNLIYNKGLYRQNTAALIGYKLLKLLERMPGSMMEITRAVLYEPASDVWGPEKEEKQDDLFDFSLNINNAVS